MRVFGLPQFLPDAFGGSRFQLVLNFTVPGFGSSRDVSAYILYTPDDTCLAGKHLAAFICSLSSDHL